MILAGGLTSTSSCIFVPPPHIVLDEIQVMSELHTWNSSWMLRPLNNDVSLVTMFNPIDKTPIGGQGASCFVYCIVVPRRSEVAERGYWITFRQSVGQSVL